MAEEELLAASPAALASAEVALGAESSQQKEQETETAAAVKIQAAQRGRAMRERKRAELKAKAAKQRRRINEQLDEQEAQLQNAVLKQEHDADAQRHAEELEQSSVRKQQLLNERLAEKRRQLEEETYCLGLCTRQTELGRANAAKRRATAVRQMGDEESQREQEWRAKDFLTTASKWNAEQAATAAARSRLGRAASAVKLPAGAWSIEVDRDQRKREPILKLSHFLESGANVLDGVHPQRNKPAWVKLKPGCSAADRAGKWIECYPFAVTDGGLSCQVFESVLYMSDTGINASTLKFEDMVEFQKELPKELHLKSATDTDKDKQNIGATAEKLRTGLINFLTTGDDVAGQKRTVHSKNLLLFSVYFASLCAMTVLVMLVPRMLVLAWLVVIGLGTAGYIGCDFSTIWLLLWLYTTLLLLVPGSMMGNTDPTSYWPNAAGYLFVGVLWCSGWIFMWVQGKGDQHALACVRTVMWDDSKNAPVAAVTRAFHIQMTDAATDTDARDADGQGDATADQPEGLGDTAADEPRKGQDKKLLSRDADGQGDAAADQPEGLGDTAADEPRKGQDKKLLSRDADGQGDAAADQPEGLGDTAADEPRKRKNKKLLSATTCSDDPESWNDLSITSDEQRNALWTLQECYPELRTHPLELLKFHTKDKIVLKTGPDEGWCTGYLKRDETTDDQLSLMERMPRGLTMQVSFHDSGSLETPWSTAVLINAFATNLTSTKTYCGYCRAWLLSVLQLKLWTAAYEGFAYCSFSFFPAMPWENIRVPPGVPPPLHPQNIFLSGIFELQTSSFVQSLIFVGAFLFVPLAFLCLYLVRNNVGRTNLVIEIAFAALTFPVMKRFTDVFACTSGTTLVKDKQLMSFKRLCETPAPLFEDCMDVHPNVPCWSQRHHLYILAVMCMLVPYYIGSLIVRSNSQAKSSAVIIDGICELLLVHSYHSTLCNCCHRGNNDISAGLECVIADAIVAFQLKFVLAVLASGWGDCHPVVLIVSVESVVIIMAAMSTEPSFFRRRYSNVLELNAVRATGLMAAAFNGFYAVYITARYGEETCNPPEINRTTWDFGRENMTHFDGAEGPEVKATLAEFIVLLGINLGALVIGYGSYSHKKNQLTETKNQAGDDDDTVAENVHQVDYQLVNWRLQVEKAENFDLFLAEFRDEEEATVSLDDKTKCRLGNRASGQQIEEVTLDKVLFTEKEVNTQRKDLKKPPIRRIHVKDFDIRTEGGHRLSSKLKAIVESRHPTGMIPKARQSCKTSINRCACCELHCCRKGSQRSPSRPSRRVSAPPSQGDACAVSCCGKERRCKRVCGPPGFAPYKMSVSFRRLRGALYGHESDSSDDDSDDDEVKAPLGLSRALSVSPSDDIQSMRKLGRSRAQTVSSHVSALVQKGMSALPESAVTAAAGLASQTSAIAKKGIGLASQTTAIAKKQLIAVPFLPFATERGLTNVPAYVQLLQLVVQTPDLTSLDLRGCDYPLEYFLQDKIVDAIPVDKRGQLMTDLEEIIIDFNISATDTQSYVKIKRFDKAKHVVQRIRQAVDANDSVIHSALNLSLPSPSGEHDADGSKPIELYPDHLYILMGYLKKMGRFDCDTGKSSHSSASTPDEKPRKKSRSNPQERFTWAPKLKTLDISDNTHLIGESNRKGIEKRIMHRLLLRQKAKPERESFQNDLQRETQTEDKETKTSEEMTEMRHAEQRQQSTIAVWTKMCECLRKNTHFRVLRFRNIGIGPTAMETTVRELLHPKDHAEFGQRLKELDISKNPLGTVGKAALAESFRSGDGLQSLNVVTISLGDDSDKKFHLSCTVLACEGLVDRDIGDRSVIGGANDVYVSLAVKGQRAKRTSVITEGGTSPTWSEQHAREFTWSLDHFTTLEVSVWDKDILSADDLLGGATITKQSVEESTAGSGEMVGPRWFELKREGKDVGSIQLELGWEQSKYTPQTLERTNSSLDLSGRSLSSEDTAFLSGWLYHCRATIQEILINNNPNFVGETGRLPGDICESEEMLTRVRHFELFCSALAETTISSLRFRDIGMGPESAKRLLQLLSSPFGVKLKVLDLTANDLGKHGKQTVCKIIAKAQNLETLLIDLGRGHSTDNKAELTRPMKAGAATCEVNFAAKHWKLKPDDVEVLAAWVKHCKHHIVSINLSNNVELANETAIKSLAADKTVVAQRCEQDPWSALCTALTHTEVLNSLILQEVGAGVSCAHVLAYAMTLQSGGKEPLARVLTELDISGNPLALDGKAILVGPTGALQGSNIQKLSVDLGRGRKTLNRISPTLDLVDHGLAVGDSVTIAGWVLHCSRTITTLDLSKNPGLIDYRCASWEQLCTTLRSLKITDLGLADVNLGADASTLLASALESPESKLRGTLIKLDISRNPLRMGKRTIFAALPGTAIKTLKVQIGCHDEVLLDATNSNAIELCEKQLQPEDAALLAGWTSHIKDTLKQVSLADNPDFIGSGNLSETFASLMAAMADVPLEMLRLPNTGMCLAACELLADAIIQKDCKITSTLKTLDLGRNLQLVSCHSNPHTGTLSVGQDKRAQEQDVIPKRTNAKQKSEKSAAGVAETGPREWHQLCQAIKGSAITQLELHACRLEPMHAVQVADILDNKTLKTLNLSGNPNLFGLGNDHSGWEALCAAMSNKKCKLDNLVIAGVGMRHKGVDLIRKHLPRTITSLDLSDNAIGERAVVRVKTNKKGEPLEQLNPEYGGKSGHTSYGKIKTGVVCIHRETGRPYKLSTYNIGAPFGDSSACILTDLETDMEGIRWSVLDLLRTTDAYEKTHTQIGSFSHLEKLWSQLAKSCKDLTSINLSRCAIDAVSVRHFADSVRALQALKTITIEATGHGPWRGLRGRHFDERELGEDYTYTLFPAETVDLAELALGPEDLELVAKWLQLPAVSPLLKDLRLSRNDRLVGNSRVQDDAMETANASGLSPGQYRIMQRCVVRTEISNESDEISHLESGDLVEVTQLEAALVDNSTTKSPQKQVEQIVHRTRMFCPKQGGWISDRNKDNGLLAQRVRDHRGWKALCSALEESITGNDRSVAVEVSDVPLGPKGTAMAENVRGAYLVY